MVDTYLDPITVPSCQFGISVEGMADEFFLQTSPESAMKRMLAAGAPSIYSIVPVFRAGERGDLHNTEFTMLEWYEVGASAAQGIETLGNLACETLGHDRYETASYREAFQQVAGFDPLEAPVKTLVDHASQIDASLAQSIGNDRDALLDVILSRTVQPKLGQSVPLILTDYPLSQAALAKTSTSDPRCAARFELFVDGIELANGYDELLDADELKSRYRKSNQQRRALGRPALNEETTLLAAMRSGLPQSAGVALGVDRLLMAMTGARTIGEVIPLPIEIA